MKKQRIKPSKEVSKFSFFIGILFCAFGVAMIIVTFMTPVALVAVPFSIMWTSIAVFNTYRAYKNGFTEDGVAIYEVESSSSEEDKTIDFEEKLRKIDRLKREGLITEGEYNKKREAIMKENW